MVGRRTSPFFSSLVGDAVGAGKWRAKRPQFFFGGRNKKLAWVSEYEKWVGFQNRRIGIGLVKILS